MTYWGLHNLAGVDYTGFARLGEVSSDGGCIPFVNEAADKVAASLGIVKRRPEFPEQLGTTFVLVEPTVEPLDLKVAIERNWWPTLDHEFAVDIVTSTGRKLEPRPKKRTTRSPFIRGFEIATTPQDNDVPGEYGIAFHSIKTRSSESLKLGRIGLVSDVKGWSFIHDGGQSNGNGDDESMRRLPIAASLHSCTDRGWWWSTWMQDPMQPFVRGTFVADPDVDDLLRSTEPKAHDSWDVESDTDGMDPDAPEVGAGNPKADQTKRRTVSKTLKPAIPDRRNAPSGP